MKTKFPVVAGFLLVMLFGTALSAEARGPRFSFGFSFGFGGYYAPRGYYGYYPGYYAYAYRPYYYGPYYPGPVVDLYYAAPYPYRVFRTYVPIRRLGPRIYTNYVPRRYYRR